MDPKEQKANNVESTPDSDSQGVERSRSIQDRSFLTALFPLRENDWCQKYNFELLLALGVVLKLHHCPRILREKAYLGLSRYLSQSESEKQWVELAKYLLLYPLARYLKNPEPDRPMTKKGLLFHRRFHNWLQKRFERFSEKNTFFFTSWLQCKRACEPLSELLLLESYFKHRKQVLKDDPLTETNYKEMFLGTETNPNFTKLLSLVRRKLHRKLGTLRMGRVSRHACYENSRLAGGQRGALVMKALGIDKQIRKEEKSDCFNSLFYFSTLMSGGYGEDLISMIYHPRLIKSDGSAQNHPFEQKGLPCQSDLEFAFRKHEREYMAGLNTRLPRAKISGILEPLKTRIVSAGEAELYFSLKNFQTTLHGILRKYPLFRLIGRPQSPTDLSDIVPDLRNFQDPRWFSGDYKGSTDALSGIVGRAIMNEITTDLPPHIARMALKALSTHVISYPKFDLTPEQYVQLLRDSPGCLKDCEVEKEWVRGEIVGVTVKIRPAVMKSGQLMGSIVSFPILCLANALVLDRFQTNKRPLSFEEFLRSGLINGDDLLCVIDGHEEFEDFRSVASSVGFELSPGKCYEHPKYANINSASYHYDLNMQKKCQIQGDFGRQDAAFFCKTKTSGPAPSVPREVNYFNSGLFAEKHKVQERVGSESKNDDDVAYDANRNCDLHDPDIFYSGVPGFESSWKGKAEPLFPGDFDKRNYSSLPRGAYKLIERLRSSGTRVPKEGDRPLYAVATRILAGTPPAYRKAVGKDLSLRIKDRGEDLCFYESNRGRWKWFRRNHFLPISAGGLGIQQFTEIPFRVSKIQRKMANFLDMRNRSENDQVYAIRPEPSRSNPAHNVLVNGEFVKISKELTADQISTLEEFEYEKMLTSRPRKYLNDTVLRMSNPFEENAHNEVLDFGLLTERVPTRLLSRKEICQTAQYVMSGTLEGARLGYPLAREIVVHFIQSPETLTVWEKGVFSCLAIQSDCFGERGIYWCKTLDQMTSRGSLLPQRKVARGVVTLGKSLRLPGTGAGSIEALLGATP